MLNEHQAKKIISIQKTQQYPSRESIKLLVEKAIQLIELAHHQQQLPEDQPKLVDQHLMAEFYQSLIEI